MQCFFFSRKTTFISLDLSLNLKCFSNLLIWLVYLTNLPLKLQCPRSFIPKMNKILYIIFFFFKTKKNQNRPKWCLFCCCFFFSSFFLWTLSFNFGFWNFLFYAHTVFLLLWIIEGGYYNSNISKSIGYVNQIKRFRKHYVQQEL